LTLLATSGRALSARGLSNRSAHRQLLATIEQLFPR
jgi:hypothetical protein